MGCSPLSGLDSVSPDFNHGRDAIEAKGFKTRPSSFQMFRSVSILLTFLIHSFIQQRRVCNLSLLSMNVHGCSILSGYA
jgi:hypothetical protein